MLSTSDILGFDGLCPSLLDALFSHKFWPRATFWDSTISRNDSRTIANTQSLQWRSEQFNVTFEDNQFQTKDWAQAPFLVHFAKETSNRTLMVVLRRDIFENERVEPPFRSTV